VLLAAFKLRRLKDNVDAKETTARDYREPLARDVIESLSETFSDALARNIWLTSLARVARRANSRSREIL